MPDITLYPEMNKKISNIVKAVHSLAKGEHENGLVMMVGKEVVLNTAADMIESLQTQLSAKKLSGVLDSDIVKAYDGSALDKADQYIERLEKQLNESQRRERAAVKDMKAIVRNSHPYIDPCDVCARPDGCEGTCMDWCDRFEWRGVDGEGAGQ